jgi:hypothetical protein
MGRISGKSGAIPRHQIELIAQGNHMRGNHMKSCNHRFSQSPHHDVVIAVA